MTKKRGLNVLENCIIIAIAMPIFIFYTGEPVTP